MVGAVLSAGKLVSCGSEGFAHGFMALKGGAVVYKATNYYAPRSGEHHLGTVGDED